MSAVTDLASPLAGHTCVATRVDLFCSIHKALRLFMADSACALGRLDVQDEEELRATLAQLVSLLALLRRHVQLENEFVHPAIEQRLSGASLRSEDEHAELLHTMSVLEAEAHALRVLAPGQRQVPAHQLYQRFSLFFADKVRHLHIEESNLNAALWAHYSDSELLELQDHMVQHLGPAELGVITHWLATAVTPQELVNFLNGMQAKLPAQAYTALVEHARVRCGAVCWKKGTGADGAVNEFAKSTSHGEFP